jgi:hypothetical protein
MNLNLIKQCPTPLNCLFFSNENRDLIQRGLRQYILNKYGVRIDKQSPDNILVIMRAVFINNAYDNYNNIEAQVKQMNARTIEMASENIMTAVAQYYGYIKDVDRPLQPPPVPRNTSLYGVKIGYNSQIGF